MSANKNKPVVDSGLCRCCGNIKKCRLLNVEYEWLGRREVYCDMFVDCFGLVLSNLDVEPSDCLICATCVTRLRDATTFREQVLSCEQRLLQSKIIVHEDKIKAELEIKRETEGDSDPNDADYLPEEDSDGGVQIKLESPPDEKPKKRMVSKRKPAKKVSDDHLKAKNELMLTIKKMKTKLEIMNAVDDPSEDLPLKPSAVQKSVDKEINSLRNAVTIVQNSFVCPFLNTFSDYNCIYCKEMFTEADKLREHTLTHDPSGYEEALYDKKLPQIDITKIDCRLCPITIENLQDLKEHIVTSHGKVIYSDADNEFLQFKLKSGKMECVECGASFGFFHGLKRHMAEHFGTHICELCGAHYFDQHGLTMHMKSHEVKMDFPCDQCGRVFKSKHGRNYHVTHMHNKPQYPCYKCDEILFSYSKRYRHMIDVHGETRSFACENCDRVYDSRKGLREHNRRTHLKVLRHECTVCDKKFYQPSALKDHMTSHTGERNFRCEYCGKTYPRMRALRVHLQSHDSEKRYKCSLCNAAYTQANNLKNHIKTKHHGFDVKDDVE
ncbi:zinc finger protein 37-like [Amyelois transitella]|uniref:zinc finger protein 37-like n=1 Tax=Amyelois transitella TaxID=680683 RepID=UPI0029903C9E|nr:zinc finger protein 37-like [Amyelois transitella]